MSKGLILLYDDDKKTRDGFETIFPQLETKYEFFSFETQEELIKKLSEENSITEVKALIFDLAKDDSEIKTHEYSITKYIKENFESRRIPIVIHSAHADSYVDFEGCGTVFKLVKSDTSIGEICDRLKLMCNSGFLEIFCPGGIVQNKIMIDLHNSFTRQFKKDNEIIEIIKIINSIPNIDHNKRVLETFERIGIRSLMSNLMIDKMVEDETYNEVKISVIEHYIRRVNLRNVPIWTGDIFETNDQSLKVIVLTPRCDVATKGKTDLLVCKIEKASDVSKGNIADFMSDNVKFKKFRFLPYTPIFEGGKVNLSEHFILSKQQIGKDFNYRITLSEDLTNEVIAKFCAYLLRTSIPEVDQEELKSFLNSQPKT